jgi:outer membrane cobalamin receptor
LKRILSLGLVFLFLEFCVEHSSFSQKSDLYENPPPLISDSLSKEMVSDTTQKIPENKFIDEYEFRNEILDHFSNEDEISFQEIDDSFVKDLGDILMMTSLLNIVKIGPLGQLDIASLGGNQDLRVFIDGVLYEQQSLDFPQRGVLDLNSIPLENIEKIEILPSGIANLWGRGSGLGEIDIITKNYQGGEPYSRATVDRGPYGYRKAQVELGRGVTARGKIYLTGGFKKSSGYLINSDYDGMSFSEKATFGLKRNLNLRLSAYQYTAKLGLPLFRDLSIKDARKREDNWGIVTTTTFQQKTNSLLKLDLRYDGKRQKLKSGSSGFEIRKIDQLFSLKAAQTWSQGAKHYLHIEGYGEIRKFEAINKSYVGSGAYLSLTDLFKIKPKSSFLLFSKIEKDAEFKPDISAMGGFAQQIYPHLNLFTTFGRFVGYPSPMDLFWNYTPLNLEGGDIDYVEEGNRNLKPQRSAMADLGVSLQKRNIRIKGYIFASKIHDFILWSKIDSIPLYGYWKPINTKADIWGINLNSAYYFLNHLESSISYCYKESKNSNQKLSFPYSPQHTLFGYLQYENEFLKREIGLKLRLETNILSERFLDEYEKDKESSVAILNGKITLRFLDFHFYYVVENITDRLYRLTESYPMPKRSLFWGFYWEFFD